jgi:hypothetical protein
MREITPILMPDGKSLASHDAYMMMHPGLGDEGLKPGDLIELEEGIFQLNDDLNPVPYEEKI